MRVLSIETVCIFIYTKAIDKESSVLIYTEREREMILTERERERDDTYTERERESRLVVCCTLAETVRLRVGFN